MDGQIEIAIYQSDNQLVEVRLQGETVWLRQEQIAELFGRDRTVIGRHIRNVFAEGELARESNVQNLHIANSDKPVSLYSLDVIISVGYRVKSTEGVRFRQWATRLLREHLTRGYTLNRQRFEANARELEAALSMVRRLSATPEISAEVGCGLADIVSRYAQTFLLLQRYDEGLLTEPVVHEGGRLPMVAEARQALAQLKASLMARGEATSYSLSNAATDLWRCWVTSIKVFSAILPTPALNPRRRICCISSSRIIHSPMATSAAEPSYSLIS